MAPACKILAGWTRFDDAIKAHLAGHKANQG